MFREVKVGDIAVPMLANGATPIRYKRVFHKDILKEFKGIEGDEAKIDSIGEIAFIMAMQAKAQKGEADMSLLNDDAYIEWLEQFNPFDIDMAADQIVELYIINTETTSDSKKK